MAPGTDVTVTRKGSMLVGQVTGQDKFRLFATSQGEFNILVVEASVSFLKDATGKVDRLVLHQDGDHEAKKK